MVTLSGFWHPDRGRVDCPAAPLLQAHLERAGVPSELGTADRRDIGGTPPEESATLVATTFTMPGGEALGLAAAAPPRWIGQVRQAVADWSAVVRTRRLFVPAVVADCREGRGAVPGPVPRPARGGQHACPLPHRIESAARAFAADGDTVLLVGDPDPSAPGGLRQSGAAVRWVRVPDVETARRTALPPSGAAAFVLAPCTSVRTASEILAVLRARLPRLRGVHPDQWCYRADDNRAATAGAVAASDLVLDLGAGTAPPVRAARPVVALRSWQDLAPERLRDASTVTVVNTAPFVPGRLQPAEVEEVLAGLGPLAVVHHRVVTETRLHLTAGASKRSTV
ncbi:hypothetical protein KSE_58040 [Kitasatospora setae KM-6054]|uniref:4-hydroxy-3-methylbut-2-enyl diphosphate reductase n=1 Tax=Kitasatospora setae (strain ATCC 33774 / DSM 43861 / JCM 3304 / KCC A-0304 / NBRC 14216 / KM-6054) TaxID=452652 RepID=E4N3U4_KITSK|nr:hypothetical protein KSE_58040 [Kitasatospora setae KM-6054]